MFTVFDRIRRAALGMALAGMVGTAGAFAAADAPGAPPAIAGLESAAFQDALTLWLEDEEERALRALAALAADGNAAAQLLLGIIDRSAALQGPWLARLPRGQRIDVLRRPGGISGRSWLSEQRDHPIAAAWLTRLTTEAEPDIVARFAAMGEERAAREAFAALLAREHPGIAGLDAATVDPELLFLLWSRAGPEQRAAIAALVPQGHPQRLLMGETVPQDAHLAWLRQSPAARPVAALCAATCPDDAQDACLLAAHAALPSHQALLTLGTPVAGIIAQDSFAASPRGQGATLRRMLLGVEARGRRALVARVQGESQCLGDRLAAEQRRYMYSRPLAAD